MSKNKLLNVLIVFITLMIVLSNTVYAGTDLLNMYGNGYSSDVPNKLSTGMNRGIYTAKIIAVGISVIMLIVLGIKYMTAAPGSKAEVKKHLVVYVIGASISFGAYVILSVIQEFAEGL